MFVDFAIFVFWLLLGLVVYVYIGYPIVLWTLATLFRRPVKRDESHLPRVSVLAAAYNEERVLRKKIENTLQCDYPRDKLEIIVGSDCSTDQTDDTVRAFASQGVRLYRQPERRGKTSLLNSIVPLATGEVLVFTDANSMYNCDALKMLVRNFADEKVGFVTGEQRYSDATESAVGYSENLYWRYDLNIRRWESAFGSMVGADGAIYALRRELYEPLKESDINDFVNPLQVVAHGWRGIFEPAAFCYECTSSHFDSEFRRKVRICNRGWRGALQVKGVLDPFRVGFFAWQLLSHKILRWLVPFFLIPLFVANVITAIFGGLFYQIALASQAFIYALALLGSCSPNRLRKWRIFYIPYYFCLINGAAFLGVLSAWRGQAFTIWQPERGETREQSESQPQPV